MRRRDFLKRTALAGTGISGVTSTAGKIPSDVEKGPAAESSGLIYPVNLRGEYRLTPLGIDSPSPRLSWQLKPIGNARNQAQTAYRIRVFSSKEAAKSETGDLWDSGKIESGAQLHVEYNGSPLQSSMRCFWTVEVWDSEDRKSTISDVSWFEMGLLSPRDWTGGWITNGKSIPESDEAHYDEDPAPLFRTSFKLEKSVAKARLYSTALGYQEVRLNGQMVGNHVLDPAWTNTDKRVYYSTYDVADLLREGENVLGAMLGNGWRNPLPLRMWGRINIREHLPVGPPSLLTELVIEFRDGTTQRISSDSSWKTADGPLLRNSVYLGERYDARREQTGWDQPGFDDSEWANTSFLEGSGQNAQALQALPMPPIRATRTVSAISVNEIQPGVFIFDLGQNFAGWARLKVEGPRGTIVQMRMGELLYEDGTLNPMTAVAGQIKRLKPDGSPVGGPGAPEIAWQENSYTLSGNGPEVYTPRFTFHGFRYVEVTGFPGTPDLDAIQGIRLNTDIECVGSFRCSNELFNRIQDVTKWTFLSNIFSVQSDCPAREKYQYGGDIVASSEMALLNYDMAAFYAKAVSDFSDAAKDGWFTETAPFVGIAAANYVAGAGPIG